MNHIIAAVASNGVIGRNNKIPWDLPEDMKLFSSLTRGNTIIMGRLTYESIGRPLPKRQNIVVTSRSIDGITTAASVQKAMQIANREDIYFIGGNRIYEEGLQFADFMHISHVHGSYGGDSYFPLHSFDFPIVDEKVYPDFTYRKYQLQ